MPSFGIMEANINLENCVTQGFELKSAANNIFNFELPVMPEGPAKASCERTNVQELSNGCYQNDTMCIQKPTEVFKNDCSSVASKMLLRRTSFMKLFDPLHSMQQIVKIEDDYQNNSFDKETKFSAEMCDTVFVNKSVSSIPTHDTLISLESPKKLAKPLIPRNLVYENTEPVEKYSKEDFCQALKVHEFNLRREFSQKYSEYEKSFSEKDQKLNGELSKLVALNRSYSGILSELLINLESMKMNTENTKAKFEDLVMSNERLKVDITTSKEDLCIMESAFSDVYKRYETSKSMIKSYEENKEHLKKNIESVLVSLDEQKRMNEMLESRTQDLMDKATTQIENAKKSADTQKMILEAQLKKSEVQIGSLENDLKQARTNNDKLRSIYDDIMEKFRD